MLVLLGPTYQGSDAEIGSLVAETGFATYDLRTRLKPGAWSVLRAVADSKQSLDLASRLQGRGHQCCAIDSSVGQDPERRIIYLRGIDVFVDHVALRLAERTMKVPFGALLTIVRGDVHLGRAPLSTSLQLSSLSPRTQSGATSLLVSNSGPTEVFREQRSTTIHDVFVAADIHFVTVPWLARIDARDCEFSGNSSDVANRAERLDQFIEGLAAEVRIRVDRNLKTSSLASHTAGAQRTATPSSSGPISTRRGSIVSDDHFDAYSRMIGEAERQTFRRA
ncbi:MAG TPA: hypothetical protein VIV60_36250 [Polyangiaceae bacterium]